MLPLLITLIGADLAVLIDQHEQLTSGMIVGAGIRYMCLFILGGFVAALHSDEIKPLKLVQLGIAAPALITSYISVGPVNANTAQAFRLPGIISTAHASDSRLEQNVATGEIIVASGFLNDVFKGWSKPLDKTVRRASVETDKKMVGKKDPGKNRPSVAKPTLNEVEKRKQALLERKKKIELELRQLENRKK
ncbi:MAG: hypothetical protein O3C34_20410 [Proteobacteria bacterium]|nr:hypothetical protein [Pseudomonadota bacterium]